ncbi:MAG: DoxX family protein [Gammaproteobacteria bacterium]|nr:DoxX family protein [Gammaproteobacteria bacterium]
METFLDTWKPRVLSILRIVTAFMFIQHGTQKMFGFPAPQHQPFELYSMFGAAGVLEVFGGLLILLGLFTRPVAFLLSGEMAFAYFIVHAPQAFWPLLNGGELAVMWCFTFLYLACAGGGTWSLDHLRDHAPAASSRT